MPRSPPLNEANQAIPIGGEEELMYVGLDVHKRACYGTATDDEGHIIKSSKFSSNPEGLRALACPVIGVKWF